MLLDEFFDYKNKLMETLCKNEAVVRLVTDSESAAVPNYDLSYKQIYPLSMCQTLLMMERLLSALMWI